MPGPNENHLQPGIEYIGADPGRGNLYTDSAGKAFREADIPDNRPHLEGPAPSQNGDGVGTGSGTKNDHGDGTGAARGIGGTHVAASMSPAQMMVMADQMEQDYLDKTHAMERQGPSARRLSGGTRDSGYNTELTSGAEKAYRSQFGDKSDRDYDLRGAFASHLTDGQPVGFAPDTGSAYFPNHLPDTYKKPNHDTFSNESQYADEGHPGSWGDNDKFLPSAAQKGVPDWLHQYMNTPQGYGGHQSPSPGLDQGKMDGYIAEQELLRQRKALRKN